MPCCIALYGSPFSWFTEPYLILPSHLLHANPLNPMLPACSPCCLPRHYLQSFFQHFFASELTGTAGGFATMGFHCLSTVDYYQDSVAIGAFTAKVIASYSSGNTCPNPNTLSDVTLWMPLWEEERRPWFPCLRLSRQELLRCLTTLQWQGVQKEYVVRDVDGARMHSEFVGEEDKVFRRRRLHGI